MERFRMFRSGDFKIVRVNGGDWELYDMKEDPSELNDLSSEFPGKLKELSRYYERVNSGF